ncbi:hemolysin family protein [Pontibacter sp. E15-1]|uniref:hemolysin family protein n=1 Tax=Pontibacter sp. E15-1 TaxID=2919918 RepID=UPI001F5002F3|nr:hemolysin family protein [Pontibacter sp. E15-1]MCJ8166058.1 hemolysin family protein [Pontibacter sp. E15-1]
MKIVILILLTLLNGFFALSELSIISVNKHRVAQRAKQGSKGAKAVLKLLDTPEEFLSAIQVGITLIAIVSGAYGGAALSGDVEAWLLGVPFLAPYADTLSIVLVVGLITYFSIVVGELIPKSAALGNADAIAIAVSPAIQVFTKATMPLVKLLSGSTNLAIKLLGIKEPSEESMSEEEVRQVILTAGRQGILAKEEIQLHQNIFSYAEQRARHLRTHRQGVEFVDLNQPLEAIRASIAQSAHSKFPATADGLDHVVGILTAKRFYEYMAGKKEEPLRSVLQRPILVPETMRASEVLNVFKQEKQYIGIVVDEYGTVEGVITVHDILEAIVGDMPDVDEAGDPKVVVRRDGSLLVSGSVSIHELNRSLRRELIRGDDAKYATLAGFVSYTLGRLPATGDSVQVNGYELEVVDMDGYRVDKLILKQSDPTEAM